MERITSSIAKTPEVIAIVKKVRSHYRNSPKAHTVMARATEIGLSVLDAEPELLIDEDAIIDNNNAAVVQKVLGHASVKS
jgi:hypothetical protein